MAIKKYVSLSKLSTFLDNLKNLFAAKETVDELSTNVAYINTTDNETITDTEISSSSVTVDSYLSTASTNPVQNKVITNKLNEISQAVEDNAKAIEENAKIDVVAEIGQTIRVKEVDGNGKPTSWEAVDLQEKICGTEMAFIVPEQECVFDEDSGYFMAQGNGTLTAGNTYNVTYNGNSYSCECVALTGEGRVTVNALGNVDVLTETGDNGMPFVIVVDGAAAGMPGVFVVMPLDGAETVTLSIEGEVVVPIPVHYLTNALPYYIVMTPEIGEDGKIFNFTCNETVSFLESVYRRGRELIAKYSVSENDIIITTYMRMVQETLGNGLVGFIFAESTSMNGLHRYVIFAPKEDGTYLIDDHLFN